MTQGFSVTAEEFLGDWLKYDYDVNRDVPVMLRIRPLSDEQQEKVEMDKKIGKRRFNRRIGMHERIIPDDKRKEAGRRYATWMWTDTRNFWRKISDEETAKVIGKEMKREFKAGETICFDGAWTDDLRRLFVRNDMRIANFIARQMVSDEQESAEEEEFEEELGKNSQPPLISESDHTEFQKRSAERV